MQTVLTADLPQSHTSSTPHFTRPTFLMCPPEWYDVSYVINPWMAGNVHRPSRDRAFAQWRTLFQTLRSLADVRVLPAEPACPDMTFVAHAATIQHGVAAVSSFAHPEREPEELYLRRWLSEAGFLLWNMPAETAFEGEGDALFDESGRQLWVAHGPRTCERSQTHLADAWHVPVRSLHLVDPRFYHLDTCFAPLPGGFLVYFPAAFGPSSLRLIEQTYPADRRIAVTEREATQFACNILSIGQHLLMGKVSGNLPQRLTALGFNVQQLDMSEFLRGGGSVKSLALRLSDSSLTARPFATPAA